MSRIPRGDSELGDVLRMSQMVPAINCKPLGGSRHVHGPDGPVHFLYIESGMMIAE